MQLTDIEVAKVLAFLEAGLKQKDIAIKMNVNQSTISRVIKKFTHSGLLKHSGGNGRPSVVNADLSECIMKEIKINPKKSLRKISKEVSSKTQTAISKNTVQRHLNSQNIFAFSPIKKPLLSKRHVLSRKECASEWITMNENDLKSIIFSDESKFNLFYSDGKVSVWREPGKGLNECYLSPTIKHGGGSVMVWACFSYYGPGNLVFIDGTMDAIGYVDILSRNLQASATKMGLSSFIFQQDNDPKHTAKLTKKYFERKNIRTLCWPAQSPDMNPIENLWGLIKTKIAEKKPKNINELKQIISKEWSELSVSVCQKYAMSFRKRTMALIRAEGKHTKY